jgi:hypothetical protein
MVSGKAAAVGIVVLIVALVGAAYVISIAPPTEPGVPATLPIQFTPMDKLAGEQDAATSAVSLYSTDLVIYETVTMDAASKESVLQYTTGQKIGLYVHDASDTSICKQYAWVTVPLANDNNMYDNAFQMTIWNTDREVTMPMFVESGGTEITDGELEDLSTNGWDSAYAYVDFELRPDGADTGYINSENFLKGYANNHMFVIEVEDVSGASTTGGWAVFNILGGSGLQLDRNDHRYFCFPLSDTDLTRDLRSNGEYDPTGLWTLNLALDLTGFASGMNVTVTYDYIMYGDWNRFVESGTYGADVESTTDETFHIQY